MISSSFIFTRDLIVIGILEKKLKR